MARAAVRRPVAQARRPAAAPRTVPQKVLRRPPRRAEVVAPGPVVTGWLGDQIGLQNAMMTVPIISVIASGFYFLALKNYAADRASFHGE